MKVWINDAFQLLPAEQRDLFVDDERFRADVLKRRQRRLRLQRAKALQQYFTCPRLIAFVLHHMSDFLCSSTGLSIAHEQILFLEPSCGDGRLLKALYDAGARRLFGCEIDHDLCTAAMQHCPCAHVAHGDFFTSSRPTSALGSLTIAIGNPPFFQSSTDRHDCQSSLVLQFLKHVAYQWRAVVVGFILPLRCSKEEFMPSALAVLNGATGTSSRLWRLVRTFPLVDPGFVFEFRDSKVVKQPSVFQIYTSLEISE